MPSGLEPADFPRPVEYPFGRHISQRQRVEYGVGVIAKTLHDQLETWKYERVVVVTGNTLSKTPSAIDPLTKTIGDRYRGTFVAPKEHGDLAAVLALAGRIGEEKPDCVVSFGGGGIMELGKATASALGLDLLTAERFNGFFGSGRSDALWDGTVPPGQDVPLPLPQIAVPTTLSAGQHTATVAFIDPDTHAKRIYFHPFLLPDNVFLDPEVTIATPDTLWASSGIKALDHAVEKFYGVPPHPIIDALAIAAAPVLFRELPLSLDREDERFLQYRLNVLIAAWTTLFGSIGYFKSGLSHTLGRQLGAICGVAHGFTSCITLPAVIAFNAEAAADRLQALAQACSGGTAQSFGGDVRRLVQSMGLPTRLSEVDADRGKLRKVAEQAMKDPATRTNPRPADVDDVERLLISMW
jgi:maleylacetate reductase